MAPAQKYLKVAICLLSSILVLLIGIAGNLASNITYKVYPNNAIENMPEATKAVLALFELNNNNFTTAIIPFIICYAFLAIMLFLSEKIYKLFWYIWVIISLFVGLFLTLVLIALIFPFVILMVQMNNSPNSIVSILYFINIFLFLSLLGISLFLAYRKVKKLKTEN